MYHRSSARHGWQSRSAMPTWRKSVRGTTTILLLLWSFSKVVDNVRFCLFLNWDPAVSLNSFRAPFLPPPSEGRSPIYCVSVCLDRSERRDGEESGLYRCGLRTDDGRGGGGGGRRFCAHRKSNQRRRPRGFCQRGLKRRRDSGTGTKTRKAICPHATVTRASTRWLLKVSRYTTNANKLRKSKYSVH